VVAVRIKGTNFVYFPVPKCACTSMKTAIIAKNGQPRLGRRRNDDTVHGWRGYGTREWWREPRAYIRIPGERRFCIIRDPVDRFISAYRNRVVFLRDLGSVPDINSFAVTIEQHRRDRHIWHHVRPLVDFLGRDPAFFDRVFLLDEIGEIPEYLGIPLIIPREQTEGPKIRRSDLSAQAVEHLRQFYSEDYRAWGKLLFRTPGA